MITINLETLKQRKISASNNLSDVLPFGDEHVVKIHHAGSPERLSSKLQEVILAFNHDHPRIVGHKGLFVQQEENSWAIYTVMPKMPKDLNKVIEDRKQIDDSFTKDRIIEYFYSLLDVHEYLEIKGIANGNIKPSNIFFNEQDEIFISDIGIKHDESEGTLTNVENDVPFGDVHYLAPEILTSSNKKKLTQENITQGDVWSLGIIFIEICLFEPVKLGENYHDKRIEEMLLSLNVSRMSMISR